jgi:hypothetical protein
MRSVLRVGALLLVVLVAAPPVFAQAKKAKAPKGGRLYDPGWGRRSDISLRFWPVHNNPYVRF